MAQAAHDAPLPSRLDEPSPDPKTYREMDHPDFHALYVRDEGQGVSSVELYVEGVHCAGCVRVLERLPMTLRAVAEARLDVGRSVLTVRWRPAEVPLSEVARALADLGHPPHAYRRVATRDARSKEMRGWIARIAVAFCCMGNVMLMAFALYGGWFDGIEEQYASLFRWGSLFVTIPAVVYSAAPFFRGAVSAFRTRIPHMDVPVSLGLLAGFVGGAVNVFRNAGEIYFDSVTSLVFLLLLGRFLQQRHQRAALDATELLHSLAPSSARRVGKSGIEEVPVAALEPGAVVEVRAGEDVPVDGVIVEGASSIDTKLLTGESRPEDVTEGTAVSAGTTNVAARLLVQVEKTGVDTRVGQLTRSMEEASARRAPMVDLADRIAGYFVVVVLALAAITFATWLHLDSANALEHTMALLVITCPCALGIATPLAVSASMGKAAKRGILVKGGEPLEALATPGLVVFDKTGTLTRGALELVEWVGDESARHLVGAVEAHSAHPIARALARDLGSCPDVEVENVDQTIGAGIVASVSVAGAAEEPVVVGSPAFVLARCSRGDDEIEAAVADVARRGLTPVLVARRDGLVALAALGDPPRRDAIETLERLREMGHRLALLSGDHDEVAQSIVRDLGVPFEDAQGGVSPEGKLDYVERARIRGPVVMVGDGVNDAAALAAATVGIAVKGSAETSLRAADAFITDGGLSRVVELFEGARRTTRVIRQNLAFSLLYNVVGATLAVGGFIGPLVAAVLMPLSSLTVVTNSYRSRTFTGKQATP